MNEQQISEIRWEVWDKLLYEATVEEASIILEVARRAKVLWTCQAQFCGYDNGYDVKECAACRAFGNKA